LHIATFLHNGGNSAEKLEDNRFATVTRPSRTNGAAIWTEKTEGGNKEVTSWIGKGVVKRNHDGIGSVRIESGRF
jgi:hypothetical protein